MRYGTNAHHYPSRDFEAGLREDRQRFLESAEISLGLPSLFYASLRSRCVFETVTGRSIDELRWEWARIRGFRLGIVKAGTGFPGVFSSPGAPGEELECILLHGLSRFEQTMVAWYEWDEYLLRRIPLTDGRMAQVFVPNPETIRREHGRFDIEPWSFETWLSTRLDGAVATARDWMAQRPDDAVLARAGFFAPRSSPDSEQAAG